LLFELFAHDKLLPDVQPIQTEWGWDATKRRRLNAILRKVIPHSFRPWAAFFAGSLHLS
jgi:hypothetical protein